MSALKEKIARALLMALVTVWLTAVGADDPATSASTWVAALLSRALELALRAGASSFRQRLRARRSENDEPR